MSPVLVPDVESIIHGTNGYDSQAVNGDPTDDLAKQAAANGTGVLAGVTPTEYLRINGYGTVSCPHSAALEITGDIDIRFKGALDNWATNLNFQVLEARDTGGSVSYVLRVNGAGGGIGQLELYWTADGSTLKQEVSTVVVPFAPGQLGWVRVTRVASTGVVTFYTSLDDVTWTQLGTPVTDTSGAIYAGTSPLNAALHRKT